jgi:hypothetical protein
MSDRERGETGQFVETVTLENVLSVFEQVRGPAVTSSDVADQLDCTTEAARQKLTRLYDQGKVDKRKSGRTTIWWRTGTSSTPSTHPTESRPHETRESAGGGETAQTPTETQNTASDGTGSETALVEDVREYLEETDQPPKTAHGRGVILDVFQTLREQGTMSTGDLQEAIYPDYSEHWGSARTMWNAIDRYLEDIPGIEKAGYGEWGYTGDETVRDTLAGDDVQTDGGVYDPTEEF